MNRIFLAILIVQVLTFVAAGVFFLAQGNWRFGVAQLLLAAVQGVIYIGA